MYPIGCCGITTGAGMKPPSVPIWIHGGPAFVGSGMPLGVSAYWFAGATLTGTILTSVQLVTGTGVVPSHDTVPMVLGVVGVVLSAAT